MKRKHLPLTALLFSLSFLLASTPSHSQDCEGYYSLKSGSTSVSHTYDAGGKLVGKTTTEILSAQKKGDKLIARAKTTAEDLKKKNSTESAFDMECDNQNTTINTIQIVEANLKKNKDLSKSTATGNNPVLPNKLEVGQELPDSKINIHIKSEINMESEIAVYDRKVVAMEEVTVPAGTFNCAVITYTSNNKVLVDQITKNKVWMAKGVGAVKTEQYSKKGKLEKRSELVSFKP